MKTEPTPPLAAVDQPRLVRPRRETPKWSRLGKLLDEIHRQADNEAIYAGFVHGNTKRLDAALERIQKAATDARAILRPNVKHVHPLPAAVEDDAGKEVHTTEDAADTAAGSGLHDATCCASWNPPETAPKDGTMIIGDFGWEYARLAIWSGKDKCWKTPELYKPYDDEDDYDCYFESEGDCNFLRWMPFPGKLRDEIIQHNVESIHPHHDNEKQ